MNIRQKLEELGYTQDNIKLESATFFQDKNELELLFVYAEWNILTDDQKKQITQVCEEVFDGQAAVVVHFKGAYIDNEILFDMLKIFLEKHYKSLLSVFDAKSVQFSKEGNTIKVKLLCDKITSDMISSGTFFNELSAYLQNECFYNFEIEVEQTKTVDVDLIAKKPMSGGFSLSWALEQEKNMNKLEVAHIEYLYGHVIENQPEFIVNINPNDEQQVVVAGVVSNFLESVYQKKARDPEAEPTQGVKFSFNLTDASGSVRIVLFPSEKDVEKIRMIKDGASVAVSGVPSAYKNDFSIRARSVSTCELVANEIHYCYRGVNDKYSVVFPKPWVEVSQMDLFSLTTEKVSDYLQNNKIVMFDLETTGLDPESCTITEIGAVKIENGKCTEYFQTLVNPQTPIPQEVVEKTHITDEMVADAPTIDQVMPDFYKFVDGCILSAYNIGFDYSFLKRIGHKLRYKFDNEQIDCLDVVRQKVASLPNYKLATVSKYLDVELKNAHRALADALAAAKVFIKLM